MLNYLIHNYQYAHHLKKKEYISYLLLLYIKMFSHSLLLFIRFFFFLRITSSRPSQMSSSTISQYVFLPPKSPQRLILCFNYIRFFYRSCNLWIERIFVLILLFACMQSNFFLYTYNSLWRNYFFLPYRFFLLNIRIKVK